MTESKRRRLPLSEGVLIFLAFTLINVSLIGYGLYRAFSDHPVSSVPVGHLESVMARTGFFVRFCQGLALRGPGLYGEMHA